jgi:multidrug efflux pump
MVPFYMFSQRELAPAEDQGVVFGSSRPPRTPRSTRRSCSAQMYDVYRSFPEADSIFQITFPTGGFGGMVTKPWSERTKTTQQLLMESPGRCRRSPASASSR